MILNQTNGTEASREGRSRTPRPRLVSPHGSPQATALAVMVLAVVMAATGVSACDDGGGKSELSGYWVWVREVEDGETVLEVTDEDMEPKVGSSGWPDCPDGILCTRYGIHKVAFSKDGKFHYGYNVHTSSDYQTLGSLSTSGGVATYSKSVRFSCAHPEQTNEEAREGTFRYKFKGDELWIGVSGFSAFEVPFFGSNDEEPTKWLVFKSVTREDYYGKYMIRICQASGGSSCHPGCDSDSLIGE